MYKNRNSLGTLRTIATKKVLIVTGRSDIGGISYHVLSLLRQFNKREMAFFVASPNKPPYYKKFKSLCNGHLRISSSKYLFLFTSFKIAAFAKKNKIDVIHTHGGTAILYTRILSLFNFKIIHTFHGARYWGYQFMRHKLFLSFGLIGFSAEKFIALSKTEKENILKFNVLSEKIIVVKNRINMSEISSYRKMDRDKLKKKFNLPFKIPLVGSLSRLSNEKGLYPLLLYLSEWKKEELLPFRCILPGNGNAKHRLLSLSKELNLQSDVIFLGSINPPMNYQFLRCLDLYISFSEIEGLPYSILEAMAISLPLLLSDIPEHREFNLLGDESFFSTKSFFDFKEKVLRILDNNNIMEISKRKSMESALNYDDEEIMAREIIKLY